MLWGTVLSRIHHGETDLIPNGPHIFQATERDGRFRISTLADFDGAEVATDAAIDHCTHP